MRGYYSRLLQRFPNFYYAVRLELLLWVLVFSFFWAYSGWDGTVHYTFDFTENRSISYGYGVHWSTLQNFALVVYLLFINVGVGGLRSPRQLLGEVRRDFNILIRPWSYRKAKQDYPKPVFESPLNLIYAFVGAVAGFFIFETAWVFSYNLGNFGDWMWPIYYTQTMGEGSPFLTYIFIRNIGLLVLPLVLSWLILAYPSVRLRGEAVAKYKYRFRKDSFLVLMVVCSVSMWVIWYNYPVEAHDHVAFAELQDSHIINLKGWPITDNPNHYIMPSQNNFPQTSYTLYPAYTYMDFFGLDKIYGFYSDDWAVHGINILSKYLITFSLAYFLMVQVKTNE